MISTKRAVERSLDSLAFGGDEIQCIQEIAAVKNPVKRLGLMSLHEMARRHPEFFANQLGYKFQPPDMSYLDEGATSTIYRVGDEVIKFDKNTKIVDQREVPLPDTERDSKAKNMRLEHGLLLGYLGTTVLPHRVDVVSHHPIERSRRAIRIQQPYVDVEFLEIIKSGTPDILTGSLDQALAKYPGLHGILAGFVRSSQGLLAERGLAVDINGSHNFGVEQPRQNLRLIDAQPVTGENPQIVDLISAQFANLGAELQARAAFPFHPETQHKQL